MGNDEFKKNLEDLFKNSEMKNDNSGMNYNGDGGKNPKSKKKKIIITVAIIMAVVLLWAVIFIMVDKIDTPEENVDEKSIIKNRNGRYVAEINIRGMIKGGTVSTLAGLSEYDHQYTMELIDELIEDTHNVGLMLKINSPGGSIYETDELYEKILDYKKETGRPVFAYFEKMAASGGYYLACAADKIYCNRNTLTGSIGVTMGEIFDVTEFLNKHGIKANAMVSGRNKAMGSITQPLTEEQKEIYRSIIDEGYRRFVEVVARGRKMPVDKVKELADGRIYTASQAFNCKLVDNVGQYEDLKFDILKKTQGDFTEDIEFEEFEPERREDSIFDILKGTAISGKGDITALLDYINKHTLPISYTDEYLLRTYGY